MADFPLSDTIVISDEELKSLTDAINQRHGIDFSCYEPKSLKRRLIRALHVFKLQAIHELWMKILREPAFIYPFMDEISVGLTAMFRDPVLWRKLRHLLRNEWAIKKNLSIWHAGCSTGEEVYTMGIVLKESGFPYPVNAWATDISNQAMETAKSGIYNLMKLVDYNRNYTEYNPASFLSKYYEENESNGHMPQSLIRHVSFDHHNLVKDRFDRKFDLIFCRNVMIYFDNAAKMKLFDKFYDSLNPGGLFVIGFYDAVLPMVSRDKFRVLDLDAKIFQKVDKE